MGKTQRVLLIVVAAAVAAVAFLLFNPDEEEPASNQAGQTDQQPTQSTPSGEGETPQKSTPAPKPEVSTIQIKDALPVGGVKKIEARSGDTVRIVATSDVADELHLHGFDLSKEVAPGKDAKFRFEADIEGVFELELEERGVAVAEVEVRP